MELSDELNRQVLLIKDSINNKNPCNGLFLLIRNNSSIVNEILEITKFLDNSYSDISIGQRIWHIVNDIKYVIECNCKGYKKFYRFSNGYFNTCGDKECKNSQKVSSFKETIKEKYDGDYFKKGSDIRKKYEDTMMERYGSKDNLTGEFIEINKNKMLDKYGFEFALQSKELSEKRKKTCLDRHNTLNFLNSKKSNKTKIERYGSINPMGNLDIRNKVFNSMIMTKHNYLQKKLDIFNIILIKYDSIKVELKCNKCNTIFNNHPVTINAKLRVEINPCTKCNPRIFTHSKAEKGMVEFIRSIYKGEILENKKVFTYDKKHYDVDVLLPELNIAFEYNGLYWHSELFKVPDSHIFKTEKCKEKEVKLYHIWEDNWVFNNELCKSMISNTLGKSNKIYARKCQIKEVTNSVYKEFCFNNHIQGYGLASIRIGLFKEGELVSLMGFSKERGIISNSKIKNEGAYELVRFCSLKNTSVIGGASKMVSYFISHYKPKKIESFCDISISPFEESSVYNKIGFKFYEKTDPGYSWVIEGKRHHRLNYAKHKLVKRGEDKNMNEIEIMYAKGKYRIWDCGNYKYKMEFN